MNVQAFAPPVEGTGWMRYHAVPSLAMAQVRRISVAVDPDAGSDPNTLVAKTV